MAEVTHTIYTSLLPLTCPCKADELFVKANTAYTIKTWLSSTKIMDNGQPPEEEKNRLDFGLDIQEISPEPMDAYTSDLPLDEMMTSAASMDKPTVQMRMSRAMDRPTTQMHISRAMDRPTNQMHMSHAIPVDTCTFNSLPDNMIPAEPVDRPTAQMYMSRAMDRPTPQMYMSRSMDGPTTQMYMSRAMDRPTARMYMSRAMDRPTTKMHMSHAIPVDMCTFDSLNDNMIPAEPVDRPTAHMYMSQAMDRPTAQMYMSRAMDRPNAQMYMSHTMDRPTVQMYDSATRPTAQMYMSHTMDRPTVQMYDSVTRPTAQMYMSHTMDRPTVQMYGSGVGHSTCAGMFHTRPMTVNKMLSPEPMDALRIPIRRRQRPPMDRRSVPITDTQIQRKDFTKDMVFKAVSQGDTAELNGLLDYLQVNDKKLSRPEFKDDETGKTVLMKALLKLKDRKKCKVEVLQDKAQKTEDAGNLMKDETTWKTARNLKDVKKDIVKDLLDIAEETEDLEDLIQASYNHPFYEGQTALHIAIERRSFDHVKLLVKKGADVHARARGTFFQLNTGSGFYFGELPLSLAACTNQQDVVSFLMENHYRRADAAAIDSQGNTVLHTLVVIADNTTENTEMIEKMYDHILTVDEKLKRRQKTKDKKDRDPPLEEIENNQGLTPLKLAAKLGKIGLFRHILHREFTDEEMITHSRKITEWVYGSVRSSLYDISSIDTNEHNSVLKIVVFGSDIPNRPEMLRIEPLRTLLEDKWDRFASKLFLMNFLVYLMYLIIFTTVACYRKEGEPPFPVKVPLDVLRCFGELVSVLGAVWFLVKSITIFKRSPPNLKALYTDGFIDIQFLLQATLLLISAVLYIFGRREYVGLLVLSLALAWINVLYYARGSKQMGMYGVTMQRMILGDLLHFLCVYAVFLIGFSAAIVALIDDSCPGNKKEGNDTQPHEKSSGLECGKPSYNDFYFTTLELFKFTIGMGNLDISDHVQYDKVFYILIIVYLVLTFILMLNMLIALMGNTVQRITEESENIWNLQWAFTILDIERTLPKCLKSKLNSNVSYVEPLPIRDDKHRKFIRVEERNWRQWRFDLNVIREEATCPTMKQLGTKEHGKRKLIRSLSFPATPSFGK